MIDENPKRISKSLTTFFKGLYIENEEEKEKVLNEFHDESSRHMAEKLLQQNSHIALAVTDNYKNETELSEAINEEILSIDNNLTKIKLAPVLSSEEQYFLKLNQKVSELKKSATYNKGFIEDCNKQIDNIQEKIKKDSDYLRKWIGEKRVWLDDVNEFKLRDFTFLNGFSNDAHKTYQFKISKLICEGVLLEKIQEDIDKVIRGNHKEWLEALKEEQDYEEDYANKLEIGRREASNEADRQAIIIREGTNYDKNKVIVDAKKKAIEDKWRKYFDLIWGFEEISLSNYNTAFNPALSEHEKSDFAEYLSITIDFTFEQFKKSMFDAWKLKNLFLASEEFILNEKMRGYFLPLAKDYDRRKKADKRLEKEKEDREKGREHKYEPEIPEKLVLTTVEQEELVFGYLMAMIDDMQTRADLRTIQESEREEVVKRMKNEKMSLEEAVLKINEIRKLQKVKEMKRLPGGDLDVYDPLMRAVITLIYLTMGNKRIKIFQNNIKEIRDKIKIKEGIIKNNEGQIQLLEEIKKETNIADGSNAENENEYKKGVAALVEIKKSMEKLKRIKNDVDSNYGNLVSCIAKNLVKPQNLK